MHCHHEMRLDAKFSNKNKKRHAIVSGGGASFAVAQARSVAGAEGHVAEFLKHRQRGRRLQIVEELTGFGVMALG